ENKGITLVDLLREVAATYDQMPILVARSQTLEQIEGMPNIQKAASFFANAMRIRSIDTGIPEVGQKAVNEVKKLGELLFGKDPKAEKKAQLLEQHYELLREL
ncbi:hypothetical protein ACFLVN_04135, partial [Chloroflexota bacterium]